MSVPRKIGGIVLFKEILKPVRDVSLKGILIILIALLAITPLSAANLNTASGIPNQTITIEPAEPNGISESFYRNIQTRIEVANTSNQTSKNVRIQVPMISVDSNYQETLTEFYNMTPVEMIDEGLNARKGIFLIDSIAPGKTETIVINYNILVNPVYSLTNTADLIEINNDLGEIAEYLLPSKKIESDRSEIKNKALELTKNLNSDLEKSRAIFSYVKNHITYNLNSPYRNKGAISALTNGEGVCEDYAALFVALSRAAGIPARQVNGFADPKVLGEVWNIENGQTVSLRNYRHSWVEFFIEDIGWLPADPTFSPKNDPSKYFGYLPYTSHIAQNYVDNSLRLSHQGQVGGLQVNWQEELVN